MRAAHRARSARAAALAAGIVAVPVLMGAGHPAATSTGHPAATGTDRPATGTAQPAPTGTTQPAPTGATRSEATRGASATRGSRVPDLAVTVSDGHASARAGEVLTYLVTVRDTGSVAAPRLTVSQTLSPGLRFLSASDQGVETGGRVSWPAGLAAGGSRTFRLVAQVVKTPATLLRLAAVACVALPGSSRPVVCAAHLDRLPAAAAAVSQSGRSGVSAAGYAAIGLAAAALGLLGAVVVRRRGRGRMRRQPA
jgi:uncharacterized repeat protein (TIGR01451 family)